MSDITDSMFTQQLQNEVDTLTPARLIRYASANNKKTPTCLKMDPNLIYNSPVMHTHKNRCYCNTLASSLHVLSGESSTTLYMFLVFKSLNIEEKVSTNIL